MISKLNRLAPLGIICFWALLTLGAYYIAPNATVSLGTLSISNIRVGVGLMGHSEREALLRQKFLSKFDVTMSKDQMTLRKR